MPRFSVWTQALRMLRRDWRAGELNLLLVALVLAVAALASVSFLADRMHAGLERDARQLLGADVLVVSDQPLPSDIEARARASGLQVTHTAAFPSMASSLANGASGEPASQLAAVKAVDTGYPLRGAVKVSDGRDTVGAPIREIPSAGTVWVDAPLLEALGVRVGDAIRLGTRTFKIAHVITQELDRGTGFMNFAPRVMLPMADLASTGLITYGSRVTYRLLVAGPDAAANTFRNWAEHELKTRRLRGVRIESLQNGQPQMRETLDRAERFLSLVALLAAMIAAVAITMAARRYTARHTDAVAIIKCLGLRQGQILGTFALEFLLVGVLGSTAGVLLGYGAHWLLLASLGDLLTVTLPAASAWPAALGVAAGLVLLVGFAVPPLLSLVRVAPLRVLRRDAGERAVGAWIGYALGAAAFFALLVVSARDVKLGALTAAGFAGAIVVFALLAAGGLRALGASLGRGHALGVGWRFALAVLERRRGVSVLQTVALAVGLMALLLLAMTRNDLIRSWHNATPADAPNRFIINIQPDQMESVAQALARAGVADPKLYPMVRGRLTQVNGQAIGRETYAESRARNLVEREFNLSYATAQPPENRIVAGRWFGGQKPEASVEEGIAKTLNLRLGDVLRFDVAGQTVDAPITSLRKLDWSSMRVNFFVILPPVALHDMPQTYVTAFHIPAGQADLPARLVREFPNLTVVDTELILRQVQGVLDQVTVAVEFLFVFTLAAGVLVLYAALSGSRDERLRDAGVLRALGAGSGVVRQTQYAEVLIVGGLAGLMAGVGAIAIGWLLSAYVFDFPYRFNPAILPVGIVGGMVCAFAGGWLGLRDVLRRPAMATLRDA
ncbi:ABC transporter permease [Ralstonia sp. UBA689]|uniref:ABC transporter permease n=1 Tax=Ralstonia sp. UBA689 TaxID=1947373 RepID=UPI0025D6F49C|nr:ABC transporter permease [Ralstonia sp. UBA689]